MTSDDIYDQRFAAYLACTDEKSVLVDSLSQLINQQRASSLLDIGPGNGDLSLPLSHLVTRYLAVEPIPRYARNLSDHGLAVIESHFPIELAENFDMVLASYVVSLPEVYTSNFVTSAWRLLSPDGALVVVLHAGNDQDWRRLAAAINGLPVHASVFEKLCELAGELGHLEQRRIVTTIASPDRDRMLQALAFVWSDGDEERWQQCLGASDAIINLLESQYRDGDRFVFPFQHTILIVRRGLG